MDPLPHILPDCDTPMSYRWRIPNFEWAFEFQSERLARLFFIIIQIGLGKTFNNLGNINKLAVDTTNFI